MYIKEIVLQGFKTYQNRTIISDFDSQFNAITGLNGSGKSNILDAIQFLLGSTNKQMLRLKSNLSQLIYKQGYAGISKASVSITFLCPDKDSRPSGYQDCEKLIINRQINRQRQSKFFINGTTATLGKVKSLFRTVHLNIQNPHFLVKQGQITKIINLKPIQLLGMLEQTAGTAYYNKTRVDSEQTMKKKQEKLKTINQMLSSTIQPQMRKQRKQRDQLQAWRAGEITLKKLNRQIKCFQYIAKQKKISHFQYEYESSNQILNSKTIQKNGLIEQFQKIQEQIKLLRSKVSNFSTEQFQKAKNNLKSKQSQKQQLKKRIEQLNNQSKNFQHKQIQILQQIQKSQKQIKWNQQNKTRLDRDIERTNQMLMQIYNSQKKPNNVTQFLQKQCLEYQNKLKQMQTQVFAFTQKRIALFKQQQSQKKLQKQIQLKAQNLHQTLKQLQKQISDLQKLQRPIPPPQSSTIQSSLTNLRDQIQRLCNSAFQLKLNYKDPIKNFDRNRVNGKVFMLFKVKQKVYQKAAQVGAGGRLYNIVTDDEHTSKLLMDERSFGSNVTIMPNSKMQYKKIPQQIIQEANKIASSLGGMAIPAYQAIEFKKQVQNAILNIFGNWFICSHNQIAKKIAYHTRRQFKARCVTYDGDILDPSGTITGGYYNMANFILPKYEQLNRLQEQYNRNQNILNDLKGKQGEYKQAVREYEKKKKDLQDLLARKQKIQEKVYRNKVKVERDYDQQISDIGNRIKEVQKQKSELKQNIKKLRQDMVKKNQVEVFQQSKNKLQSQLKDLKKKLSKLQKGQNNLELALQQSLREQKDNLKNKSELHQDIQKLILRQNQLNIQLSKLTSQFIQIQQKFRKEEAQQTTADSRLKGLGRQTENIRKKLQEIQKQLKKSQMSFNISKRQLKSLKEDLVKLQKDYQLIQQEKQIFQKKIQEFNYDQSIKKYDQLKAQQQILKKSVNFTAEANNQKTQKDFKQLLQKKKILGQDKLTLLQNMNDLDYKRKQTLQKCYIKVRDNLQKILTDLLPGAVARLKMIDVSDITQGCQLQVEFNGCKKGLNQLSGGQRSLLALSFILSLLLYKPCPFYILDQIDSALDQSHTQNIGYMISQRFPQSQFILISLKQGMFNNANVLYRISFMEGESKVERHTMKDKK